MRLVILLSVIFLSGCSIFSPVKSQPPKSYLISNTPNINIKNKKQLTLFVTQPDTRAIYNTNQMAYTSHPYQISYFGENQWAETPSQMFLPLIVQTLQSSHAFKAVVLAPYVGKYDYIVSTQIIKLQQNFMTNPALLELSIRAQMIRVATGQVVAIKQFDIITPMKRRDPLAGVIAANRGAEQFLQQLTKFCVANT